MKKILIYSLVFIFLTGACDLNEKIYDKYTPQTVYTNEDGLYSGVIGAYSFLRHWQLYKNFSWFLPILGHDLIFADSGGLFIPANDKSILDNANNMIKSPWDYTYFMIDHANQVLHHGKDVQMNEEKKNEYMGHAYFLRAFGLFEIYRRQGKAIIKTEPTLDDAKLNLPLSTGEETLEQVISDFKAASERLPLYSQQDDKFKGLATKGASDALLGMAFLYKKDYQAAIEAFDAVINSNEYQLVNWNVLWDVSKEKEAYNEVIFGIQFINDPSGSAVTSLGSALGSRFAGRPDARTIGLSTFRVQRWFYKFATTGVYEGDYRGESVLETNIPNKSNPDNPLITWPNENAWGTPPGSNNDAHSPYLGKYVDPTQQSDWANKENDYFYIRFAEVLLLKAEALNELNGPTQEAINLINQVRARARLADGIDREAPADLTIGDVPSKDEFRLTLVNEKAVEFVGEGKRWWDLRRIKRDNGDSMYKYILTEWLPAYKYGTNSSTYKGYTNRAKLALKYYEKDEWLPIPSSEILLNPAVTDADQNPGW